MVIDSAAKAVWWYLLLKIAYLLVEIAFNGLLVSTIAAGASVAQIHALELFGRTLSAVALSLLVMRIFVLRPQTSAILAIPTVVICFASVFFLQKAVVNYLASTSNAEQREAATVLRFAPTTLKYGGIQGFYFTGRQSPDSETFHAILGAALFFSSTATQGTRSQIKEVFYNQILDSEFPGGRDPKWGAYTKFRERFRVDIYENTYRAASTGYTEARDNPSVVSNRVWREMNEHIIAEWNTAHTSYQSATSDENVDHIYDQLQTYFKYKNSAARRTAERRYYTDLAKTLPFGTVPADDYWCDGATKCPGDRAFVASRLASLATKGQADAATAFDPDSRAVGQAARTELAKSGLKLPDDWKLSDKQTFLRVAGETIPGQAKNDYDNAMVQLFGHAVMPNLSLVEFEQEPAVQQWLRQKMAHELGSTAGGPVSVLWSHEVFDQKIADSGTSRLKSKYMGETKTFANHQERAEVGINSIRLLLVPFVSVSLSLFWGLANIVSVLTLLLRQISTKLAGAASVLFFAGVAALVIVPMALPIGLSQYPGYDRLFEASGTVDFRERVLEYPVKWVLRMEPEVLPYGEVLRSRLFGTQTPRMNEAQYCKLESLDNRVIGFIPGSEYKGCE